YDKENSKHTLCSTMKIRQFIIKKDGKIIYEFLWPDYDKFVEYFENRRKKWCQQNPQTSY
ncbi:MAG: hypothetical protein ACFFDI_24945, partial [Promethearchaeota archaeon]